MILLPSLVLAGCSNDAADTASAGPSSATDAVWGTVYDGRDDWLEEH